MTDLEEWVAENAAAGDSFGGDTAALTKVVWYIRAAVAIVVAAITLKTLWRSHPK